MLYMAARAQGSGYSPSATAPPCEPQDDAARILRREVDSRTAVATARAGGLGFLVVVRLRSGGRIGFGGVGGGIGGRA